jgi:hypothetical protein
MFNNTQLTRGFQMQEYLKRGGSALFNNTRQVQIPRSTFVKGFRAGVVIAAKAAA